MARALAALVSVGLAGGMAWGGTAAASPSAAAAGPARSGASPAPAGRLASGATTDWPAYLNGPRHNSYSPAETAITPASVPDLVQKWHDPLGDGVLASPTVALGAVYIGSRLGWLYKLNEKTGAVLDKAYIGVAAKKTCGAMGVSSTATVATDPGTHRATVYVDGGDGYLYALRASNLSREWRSVIALQPAHVSNYYDWSSPTVAEGKIYVGVASQCNNPFVRGGVIAYNQASGRQIARFYTVPKGDLGGSVWSSVGIGPNGDAYATTSNGPDAHPLLGYSESIVKLNPNTLKVLGWWQVPAAQVAYDGDFGASPAFFGSYVGACNKNGIFYALNPSTMRLQWQATIGAPWDPPDSGLCAATPVYDGQYLFFGGEKASNSVAGTGGSLQERLPSTGALQWEIPLPDGVIGSPTMDGGGVIAVGTFGGNGAPGGTYLIDPSAGQIIRTIATGFDFAQTVFADDWLFGANADGVYAWALNPGS
jgi:polyvinyl alcohol dehydrogenase (cytochrome)